MFDTFKVDCLTQSFMSDYSQNRNLLGHHSFKYLSRNLSRVSIWRGGFSLQIPVRLTSGDISLFVSLQFIYLFFCIYSVNSSTCSDDA